MTKKQADSGKNTGLPPNSATANGHEDAFPEVRILQRVKSALSKKDSGTRAEIPEGTGSEQSLHARIRELESELEQHKKWLELALDGIQEGLWVMYVADGKMDYIFTSIFPYIFWSTNYQHFSLILYHNTITIFCFFHKMCRNYYCCPTRC